MADVAEPSAAARPVDCAPPGFILPKEFLPSWTEGSWQEFGGPELDASRPIHRLCWKLLHETFFPIIS